MSIHNQDEKILRIMAPLDGDDGSGITPDQANLSTTDEDMMKLYEESFANHKRGEIVEGTIVSVNDHEVLIDIGYKSEGAIQIGEFSSTNLPKPGDVISVYINRIEDGEGKLQLSKRKADFYLNLEKLKLLYEKGDKVTGILRRRVKGGMIAEIMGLEAFLPGSQISLKPIPNLDQFIGKESDFKIIKLDEDRRNIIVSRKKVLEEELEVKRHDLQERIQVDAELDGEVKNITDYGAFIDMGGMDGLLHITDMSWGHINHPSEMLNIGDRLKVKIINYDDKNGRVSLGLKQLVPHPWENIEAKYPEGGKVGGKVVNLTNYGAFIELEPGVEGLVHVSEMSWTKKITHPNQMVKVGDTIEAIVLSVQKEERRISLGMKQMEPDPWVTIDERYPEGAVLTRKIKNITPFGVFVEIEDDIDGLIHISDISWTKRIYHPSEVFEKGQEIHCVVLSIDKPLHRIALGVKQMTEDPWENLDQRLPVNTEISGKVCKLIPKGLLVDVDVEGILVEGFVPMSHLAVPKLEKSEDAFEINDELPLKVIELDMENRRLILSVKAFFFGKNKDELRDYQHKIEERMQIKSTQPRTETTEQQDQTNDDYPEYEDTYGDMDLDNDTEEVAAEATETATVAEPAKVIEPELVAEVVEEPKTDE